MSPWPTCFFFGVRHTGTERHLTFHRSCEAAVRCVGGRVACRGAVLHGGTLVTRPFLNSEQRRTDPRKRRPSIRFSVEGGLPMRLLGLTTTSLRGYAIDFLKPFTLIGLSHVATTLLLTFVVSTSKRRLASRR
jgi:hypothetical protein